MDFLEAGSLPPSVTDVALVTDGLEPLALHYSTMSAHAPFFRGVFHPLLRANGSAEIASISSGLASFLVSERIALRTDDDVSLVLATRREPPP